MDRSEDKLSARRKDYRGALSCVTGGRRYRVNRARGLRPGVRGLSSRIRVRSVIGRFLEHSRVFVFGNSSKPEVYSGSADWMQRNISERVEVMFHVRDEALCERILSGVLAPYLADTAKTR
ncbi:MAG TPA: hypothetical protein VIY69_13710 [Candidatus Acidoferrales bacterium]